VKNAISIGGKARQAWRTPRELAEFLVGEYRLTWDVAADAENTVIPAAFFDEEQNALGRRWPDRCWCNPPYGEIMAWVNKANEEAMISGAMTVMLLPANVGTRWFYEATASGEWYLFDKRIRFDPPPSVTAKSGPSTGHMLVVFGRNVRPGFAGIRCAETGMVCRRY
jgi:phage N-6-adenine-methyltransferase